MRKTDQKAGRKRKRGESASGIVYRRLMKSTGARVGIAIVLALIVLAIFAPFITPYSYSTVDMSSAYQTPSLAHLCGTDHLGRDILTRLLYGGRFSIAIGILAAAFSTVVGVVLGALCGFFGGKVDMLFMRFLDIFQAIPGVLLAIVMAAVLGGGFLQTVIALGIGGFVGVARMMRASIMAVRDMQYVEAAESINCSKLRIIVKHVIPNAMAPTLVGLSNQVSSAVLAAAGLSYIGLGVQPPTPEWGAMLTDGKNFVRTYPHMVLFPGIMIMIFVLAFNLFSDALRDAQDPKLRR